MLSSEFERARSANLDNSYSRQLKTKKEQQLEIKNEELKKANNFCTKYMTEMMQLRMNANLNTISIYISSPQER